jgi:hypothetical protein
MDLECICPTHTVSVTYKLGVTAAVMIEVASLLEATEGKRPIILVAALGRKRKRGALPWDPKQRSLTLKNRLLKAAKLLAQSKLLRRRES